MVDKFTLISGNKPILLLAAHNYPHIRNGVTKAADIGTGGLVQKYCDKYGFWGLVATSVQDDPNWYQNSEFRRKAKEIIKNNNIKCVLDIHGSDISSEHLLELLPNNNFLSQYKDLTHGQTVKPFKNNIQLTIAEDLDLLDIPCLELEVRKDGRVLGINEDSYLKTGVFFDALFVNF